jgi:hypothetical protein
VLCIKNAIFSLIIFGENIFKIIGQWKNNSAEKMAKMAVLTQNSAKFCKNCFFRTTPLLSTKIGKNRSKDLSQV